MTRTLDLDRLRGWRGQEVDDSFVVDFDVRASKEILAGCVLDVGKYVLHGSRDDTRLVVVSCLLREIKGSVLLRTYI